MSDARDLDESLRLARDVFSPSMAERERVRAALARREAAMGAGDHPGADQRGGTARSKWGSRVVGVAKGLVLIGFGFALGHWTAERGERDVKPATFDDAAAPAGPRERSSHDGAPAGAPASRDERERAHAAPAPRGAAAPPAEAKAITAPEAPKGERQRPHRARTEAPHAPRGPAELELLERAERAIRAGEGALARALMNELSARFPNTRLREERAAILVLAACTLGEEDAQREALAFMDRHPTSLYFDRVQKLCNLDGSSSVQVDGSPSRGH